VIFEEVNEVGLVCEQREAARGRHVDLGKCCVCWSKDCVPSAHSVVAESIVTRSAALSNSMSFVWPLLSVAMLMTVLEHDRGKSILSITCTTLLPATTLMSPPMDEKNCFHGAPFNLLLKILQHELVASRQSVIQWQK